MLSRVNKQIKAMAIISSIIIGAFSLSGCLLRRMGLTEYLPSSQAKRTSSSTIETLPKNTDVPEWTGHIPEGKEVKYLLSHEKITEGYITERTYEYDELGRLTVEREDNDSDVKVQTHFYDERGRLIRIEIRFENEDCPVLDHNIEYEYDEKDRLISETLYTVNKNGTPRGDVTKIAPTHTYKYDEDGNLIFEEDNKSTYTYEYEKGILVSSVSESRNGNSIRTEEYDKHGNVIRELFQDPSAKSGSGSNPYDVEEIYEYNEKNDMIYRKKTEDGVFSIETRFTYTYDVSGNKLKEEEVDTIIDSESGEPISFTTIRTYTYSKQGLLLYVDEMNFDGKYYTKEYEYIPVLVPVEENKEK